MLQLINDRLPNFATFIKTQITSDNEDMLTLGDANYCCHILTNAKILVVTKFTVKKSYFKFCKYNLRS